MYIYIYNDMYISLLASSFFECFAENFECNSVETLVILSAIFLPIKSLVASAVF